MLRVNLLTDNLADARSGYVNVSPAASPDNAAGIVRGVPHDLSAVAEANECDELVALDVLDRYAAEEVDRVLDHWLSRLAHGGTLTLSIVDLREVARATLAGDLTLDQADELLHGGRRCCLTLERLSAVLESRGLKVLKRRIVDRRAVLSARRP